MTKEVTKNIFRGPTLNASETRHLSRLGVKTIINLENRDSFDETRACLDTEILLINFDICPLWFVDAKKILFIVSLLNSGRYQPTYVHCRHGRERTGLVIAAYRIIAQGWNLDRAYQEMKSMGCRWPWRFFYKRVLRDLDDL